MEIFKKTWGVDKNNPLPLIGLTRDLLGALNVPTFSAEL